MTIKSLTAMALFSLSTLTVGCKDTGQIYVNSRKLDDIDLETRYKAEKVARELLAFAKKEKLEEYSTNTSNAEKLLLIKLEEIDQADTLTTYNLNYRSASFDHIKDEIEVTAFAVSKEVLFPKNDTISKTVVRKATQSLHY